MERERRQQTGLFFILGLGFEGHPNTACIEMCTQIVSCLTNFEEGEEDAVEEAEEGELEEDGGDSEEIDLVLELSADLD